MVYYLCFMDDMLILETPNLRLRRLKVEDAEFLCRLMNSPGWLANIGDRNINNQSDAMKLIEEKFIPGYATQKGPFVIELKSSGQAMGTVGIHAREETPCPDIGYALLPKFHGYGYAFEASKALIAHVKQESNLKIGGMVQPENLISVHILKKLGLHFSHEFYMPDETVLLHWYEERL